MKILFTGASSFTGFWFVKTLAAAGHEIVCPVTRNVVDYADIRLWRVEMLKPVCRFVPQSPFGSENFLKIIRENRFDLLCHHAAEVRNYKSPDFDADRAFHYNTLNLREVLAAIKPRGLKAVVTTGTYFEPDEGAGDMPLRAFSPYSLSKGLTAAPSMWPASNSAGLRTSIRLRYPASCSMSSRSSLTATWAV